MTQQKIRPPATDEGGPRREITGNHGTGGKALGFAEDVPDKVKAPDIGASSAGGSDGAMNVSGADAPQAPPALWPAQPFQPPPGYELVPIGQKTLTPEESAELRRHMNDPNRLGKPRQLNDAEKLLVEYEAAKVEVRKEYHGTRIVSEKTNTRFLTAKQAMIDAGLMKGDV